MPPELAAISNELQVFAVVFVAVCLVLGMACTVLGNELKR